MSPAHHPVPVRFFPATRVGLIVGIVLGMLSAAALKSTSHPPTTPQLPAIVVRPPPRDDGRVPLKGPAVVNVWLQNCPDCLPAFEAWKALDESDAAFTDMHVMNVAYGSASLDFEQKFHVDENVIFDSDGALVVNPLGIHSFTTLVIDRDGNVVMRARPDQSGFATRVRTAWADVTHR